MVSKIKFLILVCLTLSAVLILGLPIRAEQVLTYTDKKEQIPVYKFERINEYGHNQKAFTQGLIYYQGELYESTGGVGKSYLRRVELKTGNTLQPPTPLRLQTPYFGEGITLWKDQLIQLTLNEKVGFVYDRKTFKQIDSFSYDTSGWGITHDGKRLIMSDGTDNLYFLDPDDFQVFGHIRVRDKNLPVTNLNELEYINGEVFANVDRTDRIARIDPVTGRVTGWIDLSGLLKSEDRASCKRSGCNPNGIAYDKQKNRIFVTGKKWPKLFEIKLIQGSIDNMG